MKDYKSLANRYKVALEVIAATTYYKDARNITDVALRNNIVTEEDVPVATKPIVIPRKPPASNTYTQERAGYVPGIGGTCPYCGCDGMTIVGDKAACWDCHKVMLWPPDKDRVLDGYTVPPDNPAKQHNEPLAKDWMNAIYSK